MVPPDFYIMHTIAEWRDYLLSKGVFDETKLSETLKYIEGLNNNNVPVIFDLEHLSLLVGRRSSYLASVINAPEKHWRKFRLQKRSGGYREIDVPYPALLGVQLWIYKNILLKVSVSPYCHGFVRKKSILTNAKWHIGKEHLLKLDLKDFFPSIRINRVISLFSSLGYNKTVSFYLAALCCLDERLPQGAPTSPYLSNLISRPLDYRLKCLAKKKALNYTRYADDLTFSGDSISQSLVSSISGIIADEGFTVNESKTRLYTRKCRRIITGICVTEKLSIPRDFKRKIRQEIHYIKTYGLIEHIQKAQIKRQNYCYSLLGRIDFWLFVESGNEFATEAKSYVQNLIRQGYGDY